MEIRRQFNCRLECLTSLSSCSFSARNSTYPSVGVAMFFVSLTFQPTHYYLHEAFTGPPPLQRLPLSIISLSAPKLNSPLHHAWVTFLISVIKCNRTRAGTIFIIFIISLISWKSGTAGRQRHSPCTVFDYVDTWANGRVKGQRRTWREVPSLKWYAFTLNCPALITVAATAVILSTMRNRMVLCEDSRVKI